ncbi:hypothetical protein HBB16_08660 [Pseudonocardia sp. MCCB 268]|nr:hypothetical protein [Pseudonocardia cytotoxica]
MACVGARCTLWPWVGRVRADRRDVGSSCTLGVAGRAACAGRRGACR